MHSREFNCTITIVLQHMRIWYCAWVHLLCLTCELEEMKEPSIHERKRQCVNAHLPTRLPTRVLFWENICKLSGLGISPQNYSRPGVLQLLSCTKFHPRSNYLLNTSHLHMVYVSMIPSTILLLSISFIAIRWHFCFKSSSDRSCIIGHFNVQCSSSPSTTSD